MLVQWLTFAVMILIQAVAAAVIITSIRTTLLTQGLEIEKLRTWRHEVGPQSMVISGHAEELHDHETRLRAVEKQRPDCPVKDCPLRQDAE
jgi:hypothetical protein